MEFREELLEYYYKIMWGEFQEKGGLTGQEIISLIGAVGLNLLNDYGRIKKVGIENGETVYIIRQL